MNRIKKCLLILSLISFGAIQAQTDLNRSGDLLIFRNKAESYNISGTPYYPENYTKATVNNGTANFDIRYNSFRDLMEYNKDGERLELVKNENRIIKFSNGSIFELKEYTNRKDERELGYLKLIASSGDWKFYERIRSYIYKDNSTNNGYQTSSLDRFEKERTEYFIEHNGEVQYVKKEKNLYKLFPNKEKLIKELVKKYKVDFSKPDTVQKLLDALQQSK